MVVKEIGKWDRRFIEQAENIAQWSKDASTKVGAIVVGPAHDIRATGYNGLPRGVMDPMAGGGEASVTYTERMVDRPSKYLWAEHAERNAIYQLARFNGGAGGCTIYINSMLPCADCARAIIQSGIKLVVCKACKDEGLIKRWQDQWAVSLTMFREAGVGLIEWDNS